MIKLLMRHAGRLLTVAVVGAVVAGSAVACGGDNGAPSSTEASPAVTPTAEEGASPAPESPTESEPEEEVSFEVWFNRGERLAVAYRTIPATRAVGRAALEQLLRGPSEGDDDLRSQVPSGSRLRGLTVSGGVATVDLSREFASGGGSLSMSMRLAQVVYTLTQFPSVGSVTFEIDGEKVEAFGGEGIDTSKPLDRDDFTDHAPPIAVTSPTPGFRFSAGMEVAGEANVFEATVSLRVLDAKGKVLQETFTTATCGSGCRGTFEKKLDFAVDEEQDGVIEAFEVSAEDGSRQHLVAVPVRLVP